MCVDYIYNVLLTVLIVKSFKKASGGYRGCLVLKVRTYFLKALGKARKGFPVRIFELPKLVLINVDARQAEPSGLSRTRHHRRPKINIPPFCEKSSTLKKKSDLSALSDLSDDI